MAEYMKGQIVEYGGKKYKFLGGENVKANWQEVRGPVADVALGAASGIPQGAEDIGRLTMMGGTQAVLGPLAPFAQRGLEAIYDKFGIKPPRYSPTTAPGRYAQAGTRGATGGAVMGPMGALTGATAALGGEAAHDVFGEVPVTIPYTGPFMQDTTIDLARTGGSFLGGLIPNIPGMLRGLPGKRVREATEGMKKADWDAAIAKQNQANQVGVPVTGPEALNNKDLLAKQLLAENHPKSAQTMQAFMAKRPEQVAIAVEEKLKSMGPGPKDPRLLGADIQQGARGAIERGRQYAKDLAAPAYKAAEEAGVTPRMSFRGQQNTASMIPQAGPYTATPRTILDDPLIEHAKGVVMNDPALRIPKGTQSDSMMVLDLTQKWLKGQADAIQSGDVTTQLQGRFKLSNYLDARNKILTHLDETVPDYTVARNLYERGSASQVTPRQQGTTGALSLTDDPVAQFGALKDPKLSNPSTIEGALRDLRVKQPEQTNQLIRHGLDTEVDVARTLLKDYGEEFSGARLAKQLRRTPQTRANVEEMITQQHGPEVAAGFNRLLDVFEMTGNRLTTGSRTAFNARQLEEMSGTSLLKEAVQNPLQLGGNWLKMAEQNFTTKKLAEVFTDPNSVQKLRELAYVQPNSAKARVLIGGILGAQEKE